MCIPGSTSPEPREAFAGVGELARASARLGVAFALGFLGGALEGVARLALLGLNALAAVVRHLRHGFPPGDLTAVYQQDRRRPTLTRPCVSCAASTSGMCVD